jgi:hypothetical protein
MFRARVLREHEDSLDRLVKRLKKLNEHLEGARGLLLVANSPWWEYT